jgi:DNA-binding SARP family transcriptional activator
MRRPAGPKLRLLGASASGSHGVPRLAGSGIWSGAFPAAGLRVAVLGPLVISGGAGELQPRQAELVGALALAGTDGLSADVLRTRLGTDPDHPKDAALLRQVITRTRRKLGATPVGGEYIIYDECSARYRLDATVRVDLEEFRALARSGRAAADPRPLYEAITLLRGHPLDGMYWWWLDAAVIERVRVEAVDAAVLLARLALEAGDPVTGRRAALSGLTVDPAAEELWRQLMLAEDTAGNTAGVQRAWARCRAAIADIALEGEPHPATAALYRSLTACRPKTATVPRVPGAGAALRARLLGERRTEVRAAAAG